MEFDLFGVYDPRPCTCGAGWCEPCGTWHRSTESEMLELDHAVAVRDDLQLLAAVRHDSPAEPASIAHDDSPIFFLITLTPPRVPCICSVTSSRRSSSSISDSVDRCQVPHGSHHPAPHVHGRGS